MVLSGPGFYSGPFALYLQRKQSLVKQFGFYLHLACISIRAIFITFAVLRCWGATSVRGYSSSKNINYRLAPVFYLYSLPEQKAKVMYKLKNQSEKSRIYVNDKTGNEVVLDLIYTSSDPDKTQWYSFRDLFTMPMVRNAMAKKIITLFQSGFTIDDLRTWTKRGKDMAKANDPEKYEKLYSLFLEMEAIAENTANPIKQQLGLATVYIIKEDERIDWYDEQEAGQKLSLWAADIDMSTFFLNWLESRMQNYTQLFKTTSQTVSQLKSAKMLGQ